MGITPRHTSNHPFRSVETLGHFYKREGVFMRSPEGHEKAAITKYLDQIGAWYFKPATGGFGKSGVSDIVGCYRGKFFSIEVKREGKEPTVLQWRRINEINEAGGLAMWGTAKRVIPLLQQLKALTSGIL